MPADNHNVILSRFAAWKNVPMWMLCNANKQPVTIHAGHYSSEPERDYFIGDMLRWKEEPQDHITTLDRVLVAAQTFPEFGIGPFIGHENTLACFDFDHCLDTEGNIKNEKVRMFISILSSYTEVSVSGTGLHVFVFTDKPEPEYSFDPEYIGDGKFYSNRFIRLTGNEHRDNEYSIVGISHDEYEQYRKFLEHTIKAPAQGQIPKASTYTGSNQGWDQILDNAGIIHKEATNYAGTTRVYSDGTSRKVEKAYRILCPNYKQHTGHDRRNKAVVNGGGDVAILTKFADGMSSVKCSHNHCDPLKYKINLLQMLWDQIKQNRADNVKSLMQYAGVRV